MGTPVAISARPKEPWVSGNGQRLLLHNVSWKSYVAIGDALRDRSGLRMTYDRGNLEIMVTSLEHEHEKHLLNMLVQIMAEECEVALMGFGSATYQREDIDRGLEPDECYYTKNLLRIRGRKRIDLTRDPPPDLAMEVEITRSALDRMSIYARIGVPEIWRYNGRKLRVYLRDAKGRYEEQKRSPTFPAIPLDGIVRFVQMGDSHDDTAIARKFRAWVRGHLVEE